MSDEPIELNKTAVYMLLSLFGPQKAVDIGSNTILLRLPNEHELFISYRTPVAGKDRLGYFRTSTKYSVTTSKHINQYIGENSTRIVPQEYIEGLGWLRIPE